MNEKPGPSRSDVLAEATVYLPQAALRRRTILQAGCANQAFLALPAAMSLGIVLARPANAQVLAGNATTGITLDASVYRAHESLSITSTTTITSAQPFVPGVYGATAKAGGDGGVQNAGSGIILPGPNMSLANAGMVDGGSAYGVKIKAEPASAANHTMTAFYAAASANNASAIYNGANRTAISQNPEPLTSQKIAQANAREAPSFAMAPIGDGGPPPSGYGARMTGGSAILPRLGSIISAETPGIQTAGTAPANNDHPDAPIPGGGFLAAAALFTNREPAEQIAPPPQFSSLTPNSTAGGFNGPGDAGAGASIPIHQAETAARPTDNAVVAANFGVIAAPPGIELNAWVIPAHLTAAATSGKSAPADINTNSVSGLPAGLGHALAAIGPADSAMMAGLPSVVADDAYGKIIAGNPAHPASAISMTGTAIAFGDAIESVGITIKSDNPGTSFVAGSGILPADSGVAGNAAEFVSLAPSGADRAAAFGMASAVPAGTGEADHHNAGTSLGPAIASIPAGSTPGFAVTTIGEASGAGPAELARAVATADNGVANGPAVVPKRRGQNIGAGAGPAVQLAKAQTGDTAGGSPAGTRPTIIGSAGPAVAAKNGAGMASVTIPAVSSPSGTGPANSTNAVITAGIAPASGPKAVTNGRRRNIAPTAQLADAVTAGPASNNFIASGPALPLVGGGNRAAAQTTDAAAPRNTGSTIAFNIAGQPVNLGPANASARAPGNETAPNSGSANNSGAIAGSGILLADAAAASPPVQLTLPGFETDAPAGSRIATSSGKAAAAQGAATSLAEAAPLPGALHGLAPAQTATKPAPGGFLEDRTAASNLSIAAVESGPITQISAVSASGAGIGAVAAIAPLSIGRAGGADTAPSSVIAPAAGQPASTAGDSFIATAGNTNGISLADTIAPGNDTAPRNGGVITGTIGVPMQDRGVVASLAPASAYGAVGGMVVQGSRAAATHGPSTQNAEAPILLAASGNTVQAAVSLVDASSNSLGLEPSYTSIGFATAYAAPATLPDDIGVAVNQAPLATQLLATAGGRAAPGGLVNLVMAETANDSGVLFTAPGKPGIGAIYGLHVDGLPASITNVGNIISTSGTALAMNGGSLVNEAGGVIDGNPYGLVFAGPGNVLNAGLIMDAGTAGAAIGSNVTFANIATGTISGTTGLEFDGTNSTVVNAGTIASDSGGDAISFSSAGVNFLTLTSGQLLIGTVDGGGSDSQIALEGTGTLTNTITDFGPTSALDIAPGANWTATGTWQIATATNDGVFQPGLIGTPLSLTGNFVQDPAGTLRVIVTPDATSQLLVTGSATLNGGLIYNFAPGTYVAKTFPFITTTNGTTGGFTTVTYNQAPANLLHATTYADNNANLVLYDQGTAAPPDTTPIVVSPNDTSIFSDENQQSAVNAQAANASLLEKAAEGDQEGAEAAVCAPEAGATPAGAEPDKATRTAMLAKAVANAFCGAGGWVQGSGTIFNANGSAMVEGYQADTAGFLAGIDKALNAQGTRLGIAVGYDESSIKTGLGSKGTVDTTRVGLFASQPVGVFTLAADIMYGHFDTTTSRVTGIGEAGSKSSGNIFSGGFEAETLMPVGVFDIIPSTGIRFASVSAGSFRESAPGAEQAFAVNGAGSGYDSVQPFVNIDASTRIFTPNNIAITPDVSVGYLYEAGTRGRAVTVDSQDGTTFESSHLGLAGSAADLEAGLSAGKGNWAFYARYTANIGGNWTSQTGEAGLRIRF